MKVAIVLIIVFGILGYLIYIARKNQKLDEELKQARKAAEKQIDITKLYEKQQAKANEIKAKEQVEVKDEKSVEGNIDTANSLIDSFNK